MQDTPDNARQRPTPNGDEPRRDRPDESPFADPPLTAGFPCPYLPDRISRSEAYLAQGINGAVYEQLMAHGFRRSGQIIYRPVCPTCRECRQLRVPAAEFRRSRSMRRIWRKNTDVEVTLQRPSPDDEKFDLFRRYLDDQHDGTMARTYESFIDFLYDSPITSREALYRVDGRLAAVSLLDVCADGLSSVYVFFDPAMRKRSLGTFSALWEIEYCRANAMRYYYLGFYVAESRTMSYKARFRPNEISDHRGGWVPFLA